MGGGEGREGKGAHSQSHSSTLSTPSSGGAMARWHGGAINSYH